MRIAFFLNDFPALSQTFVLNQITGMIDLGLEVEIFAFREKSSDTVHDIVREYQLLDKVKFFQPLPKGKMFAVMSVARRLFSLNTLSAPVSLIKAFGNKKSVCDARSLELLNDILQCQNKTYDIIHCQFGTIATRVLNLIEAGKLRGKLITSFRGYDATKYPYQFPGVYNRLFAKGDYFLPVSQSLRKSIIELGCVETKIDILHSGIQTHNFTFKEQNIPKSGMLKVITVGRLVEKKGIDYAINAIAKTIASGIQIHYNIVGGGPLQSNLQKLADKLGIADNVSFLGAKTHTEVLSLLNQSHILLACSVTAKDGDQEGIPNVMKEAMAVGLPVIGTRHGGIPELVEDGESGFLVEERDVDAIAKTLVHLYKHPEVRLKVCKMARRTIEDEFDNIKLNKKLFRIYEMLSKNNMLSP